ncbi:MAG: FosX/FosE/FosI family fosfomycin resistance hydrolase [Burkholderiaceae bacterium]|nr:FosX/FosE/FosI family fosfomycin resistance hydrolase [Burkholderiaceae bacterium]
MQGLSHLTFVVHDPDRSARLWCEALGAVEVYDSGALQFSLSREKFFTLGCMWIALMEGEPFAVRNYRHTAFKVDESDLASYRERLLALGAEVKESRPRVAGEGQSLYFYDYDNHLFELHSGTLEQRLERYAKEINHEHHDTQGSARASHRLD